MIATAALVFVLGRQSYDLIIQNGTIVDGTGAKRYVADVAIQGDRIASIGHLAGAMAKRRVDARGLVVAPGFIDMMGQSEMVLLADGRAQSKIFQGITTEVTGEGESAAPATAFTDKENKDSLDHIKVKAGWRDLRGYFIRLVQARPAINLATFVGCGAVRMCVLKDENRAPKPAELKQMQALVRQAMEQGAIGVTTALMYSPDSYATTKEIIALAKAAAPYGGIYATHMRSESDDELESIDDAIRIGREAKIPVEIFHLKAAGINQWGMMPMILDKLMTARAAGADITADQYPYIAGENGLLACLPAWAQEGGQEATIKRLKDPSLREKMKRDIRTPMKGVDNCYLDAGGGSGLMLSFSNSKLKKYDGKRLSEIAKLTGKTDELDAMFDLLTADRLQTDEIIFDMNEADVQRALTQPWIGVCCDAGEAAVDGILSKDMTHPRAFGTCARILGKYVRDEKLLSLETAIYKLTKRSADRVHLKERGTLKTGYFADLTVFDPQTISDRATFEKPMQLSTGMRYVLVNGQLVTDNGKETPARPGRPLLGPGYKAK